MSSSVSVPSLLLAAQTVHKQGLLDAAQLKAIKSLILTKSTTSGVAALMSCSSGDGWETKFAKQATTILNGDSAETKSESTSSTSPSKHSTTTTSTNTPPPPPPSSESSPVKARRGFSATTRDSSSSTSTSISTSTRPAALNMASISGVSSTENPQADELLKIKRARMKRQSMPDPDTRSSPNTKP